MVDAIRIPLTSGTSLHLSKYPRITIEGEPIGYGGSCIAYRGHYTEGGIRRSVIVKECYPQGLARSGSLTRQGKKLQSVNNPNAFENSKKLFREGYDKGLIYDEEDPSHSIQSDWFKGNNTVYIISKLQDGDSLDKNYKTLKNSHQVAEVINSLLNAIESLHEADPARLHLDIKPANVFLFNESADESRRVALFDFDTVTSLSDIKSGKARYTCSPGWCAWEQEGGDYSEMGPWTDLYAVGLLLFWLLIGEQPTEGEIAEIQQGTFDLKGRSIYYVNMDEYDQNEYQALMDILSAALRKTPQSRPQNAEVFRNALAKYADYTLKSPTLNHAIQAGEQRTQDTLDVLIKEIREIREKYTVGMRFVSKPAKPTISSFTDRVEKLAEFTKVLEEKGWVIISGIGGIGKSQLATKYTNDNKERYEIVEFLTYSGSLISTIGKLHIEGYENPPEEDFEHYYEVVMRQLNQLGTKVLVVIDNFDRTKASINEDGSYPDATFDPKFKEVLSGNFPIIFTSRAKTDDAISLEELDPENQLILFRKHYTKEIVDSELQDIQLILVLISGHTLMIELIAKLLMKNRQLRPKNVIDALQKNNIAFLETTVTIDKDTEKQRGTIQAHIKSLLALSDLSEDERFVLMHLALAPLSGIELELFYEWTRLGLEDAIENLQNLRWIDYDSQTDRISLHRVISLAATAELEPNSEKCKTYLDNLLLYGKIGFNENRTWEFYQRALELSMGAIAHLQDRESKTCGALYRNVADNQRMLAQYLNAIESYEQALDTLDAHGLDHVDKAALLFGIASSKIGLGQRKKAEPYLAQATEELQQSAQQSQKAELLLAMIMNMQSVYQDHIKNYSKAVSLAKEALRIQEHYSDSNMIRSLLRIATSYKNINEYDLAFSYSEQAVTIAEEKFPENKTLLALANACHARSFASKGNYRKSLALYKKVHAIRLGQFHATHPSLAQSYVNLGVAHGRVGDYEKALECHEIAHAIRSQVLPLNHGSLASSYNNIGKYYALNGKYDKAIEAHEKALEILQKRFDEGLADTFSPMNTLGLLGVAYRLSGNINRAIECHREALRLKEGTATIEKSDGRAKFLIHLSEDYILTDQFDEALSLLSEALEIRIKRRGEDHPLTGLPYLRMGDVWSGKGDIGSAAACYRKAQDIYRQYPERPEYKEVCEKLNRM
jgi:tetratricopeptide (TPR) repeat protein